MDRSLKIVLITFLVFLIYGLTGLFGSGTFVTPIFLHQIALAFVAILLYVIYFAEGGSILLLVYAILQFLGCFIDGYTVNYLLQTTEAEWIYALYRSELYGISYILLYFGFFTYLAISLWRKHQQKALAASLLVLLAIALTFILVDKNTLFRDLCIFTFLLLYSFAILVRSKQNKQLERVLSHQFIVLFLLEAMEYFE